MADREALQVLGERVDDDLRQRDRPVRRERLRGREERGAAGEQDQLLVDPQRASLEVEAVVHHAGAFTLVQPGAGGEHDVGAVALRDGGGLWCAWTRGWVADQR